MSAGSAASSRSMMFLPARPGTAELPTVLGWGGWPAGGDEGDEVPGDLGAFGSGWWILTGTRR
jgi:hypothetical protein